MGNIEKYGVVALIFVIVMVLAVSIWGPRATDTASTELKPPTSLATGAGDPATVGQPATDSVAKSISFSPESNNQPVSEVGKPPVANPPVSSPTGDMIKYKIQSGDNLESIAQKEMGSRSKWKEIVKANEGLNPSRLRVGQEIMIPVSGGFAPATDSAVKPVSKKEKDVVEASSTASEKKTYKVGKGDTLSDISKKVYGTSKNWKKIYDANKDKLRDSDNVVEGVVLTIP